MVYMDYVVSPQDMVALQNVPKVQYMDRTTSPLPTLEGKSIPDDSSILYAKSLEKHGVKGVLVNDYGI